MFAKVVLAICALGFLAFGIAMCVAPAQLLAPLGLQLSAGAATTEIRAFYGGLEIALGLALLACLRDAQLLRHGLQLSALCYGAVALVRAVGMLIDASGGTFLIAALLIESTLTVACLIALRSPPNSRRGV